jgi:aromatic ring hydroxylase
MRTPDEYLESLRDGRRVYLKGELVKDVVTHPVTGVSARHSSASYEIAQEAAFNDLTLVNDPDLGQVFRLYATPRDADDLRLRGDLIERGTEYAETLIPFVRVIGSDILNTLESCWGEADDENGYLERVRAYRRLVAREDLAMVGAVTDVKGDRSLRPSQQPNPDAYVRVVERRPDGIVVRGLKTHTSGAPQTNEILVLPTRAMTPDDGDWAVAFAVPANAPGVSIVARPDNERDPDEFPMSAKRVLLEGTVVFDDVFVPEERVFLCGETAMASDLANTFATWHRYTGISYKPPTGDLIFGAASLIARMNGTHRASHIAEKLARLAAYPATIRVFRMQAAAEAKIRGGVANPDPMATNLGKLFFAENYHHVLRDLQDIAGGWIVTSPHLADLSIPDVGPLLLRGAEGTSGFSGEARLRVFKLIRDLVASEEAGVHMVATVHGEGSMAAQRLAILRAAESEGPERLAAELAGVADVFAQA